jgi:hypothetical protein
VLSDLNLDQITFLGVGIARAGTAAVGAPLACGAWTVELGSTGAITSLVHRAAKATDWASEAKLALDVKVILTQPFIFH